MITTAASTPDEGVGATGVVAGKLIDVSRLVPGD
jgi:hypothetical protein